MPRPLAALVLAASVALVAAAPAKPSHPSPTPSPSPTAKPAPPAAAPTVMVFPFDVDSELPAKSGQQVAQIFDQQIQQAGGVTVLPAPAGTQRTDFGKVAQKANADFYVSGFLTAVGDGAAMVLQVVSADSGVMVFSHTAQVTSAEQASAEALTAREVILARSGLLQSPDQAPQKATPEPSPSDNGGNYNLSNFFGIFKHHSSGPPVVAAADKPSRVVLVARVTGTGFSTSNLASATQTLWTTLNRSFKTQGSNAAANDLATTASDVCGSNRNATIAGGTLAQQHNGKATQAAFTLRIYTCFGAVLYEGTATAGSVNEAITSAVTAYATSHPQNS